MRNVLPSVFQRYFTMARGSSDRIRSATSPFEHVAGTRYFLDDTDPERGFSGYAVRPDGDLVMVWSTGRGNGARIVESALRNGAETLDCFDGFLPEFYARHGFVEYAREPNWTPGEPDVVFMALPSRLAERAS